MNSDPILCFPTQQEAPLEKPKQMLHHFWKTGHHVSKSHAVWRYHTKPSTTPSPSTVLDTWSASSTTPGTLSVLWPSDGSATPIHLTVLKLFFSKWTRTAQLLPWLCGVCL